MADTKASSAVAPSPTAPTARLDAYVQAILTADIARTGLMLATKPQTESRLNDIVALALKVVDVVDKHL